MGMWYCLLVSIIVSNCIACWDTKNNSLIGQLEGAPLLHLVAIGSESNFTGVWFSGRAISFLTNANAERLNWIDKLHYNHKTTLHDRDADY